MKKFAILLLVLSLARVGVAYADTTTATSEAVTGSTTRLLNANQELVYVKGENGRDGAPGRDGADGANGRDGATGPAGAAGAAGAGVEVAAFTGAEGNCTNGGLKAISSTGTSYVCNGASGGSVIAFSFTGARGTCSNGGTEITDYTLTKSYICNGANGANGSNGTNTTTTVTTGGGSGGFTYAQGSVLVGACDKFVAIKPLKAFTRIDTSTVPNKYGFTFSGFEFGDSNVQVWDSATAAFLDGGIDPLCNNFTVTIEFFTDSAYNNAPYQANDHIVCTSRLVLNDANYSRSGLNNGTKRLLGGTFGNSASGDFACKADSGGSSASSRPVFPLANVSTEDYTNAIGFQIG